MRSVLGWAALAAVGVVMATACGNGDGPNDKRVFRDNFDSLASGWKVSGGVSVENGSLLLAAGAGGSAEAVYDFPTPAYGPGWELESTFSPAGGSACLAFEVYAGDVRRHTWDLEFGFQQDTADTRFDWKLQVGDGADNWEALGESPGAQVVAGPVTAKIRVSGEVATLWVQNAETLVEVVTEASEDAVSIKLKVSRCKIRPGAVAVDWVEVSEL